MSTIGAGNLVVTGYTQASARGASADFGTATFSVGAGTITSVGSALSSYHITRVRHLDDGQDSRYRYPILNSPLMYAFLLRSHLQTDHARGRWLLVQRCRRHNYYRQCSNEPGDVDQPTWHRSAHLQCRRCHSGHWCKLLYMRRGALPDRLRY